MEEELSPELSEKIRGYVEKVIEKMLERASKGESIEGIIKTLITEKVMNYAGPLMRRYVVKKAAKKIVRKVVD